MNKELIRLIEQLIEFGYGDTLRLDSIINALQNGRSLYPSDQKYVDMLISKYLYPESEEVQDLKNQIVSLKEKIENMKGWHHESKKRTIGKTSENYCSECGSLMARTHIFCPKCGANQGSFEGYTRHSERGRTGYQKAGIVIVIIVVALISYGALNLYALSSLQFRSNGSGTVDFTDLSVPVHLQACNPTYFPASFDKLSLNISYKSTDFGDLTLWGKTIMPKTAAPVDGELKLNGQGLVQLFIGAFASAFSGQQNTFDPSQMHITSTLDASLFGIIPFSISKDYSANEFKNMITNTTSQFSC